MCIFVSNFCNAQMLDREKGIQIDADSVRMEFDKERIGVCLHDTTTVMEKDYLTTINFPLI